MTIALCHTYLNFKGDTKALHRTGVPTAGGVRFPQRQREPGHQHRLEAHGRAAALPGEESAQNVRKRTCEVTFLSFFLTCK